MQEVQAGSDLLDDLGGIVLREANVLLNACQQRSAIDFLKHQIEFVLVLEELDQLQDARVSLAMVERLHLPEYPSSGMSWNLVDDFHRILQIGVNINAGLHGSVSPFAQYLTGQLV